MCLEDSYVNVEEEVLHWPRCHSTGGGNLHHIGVIVYDRREDEETTWVTVVEFERREGKWAFLFQADAI